MSITFNANKISGLFAQPKPNYLLNIAGIPPLLIPLGPTKALHLPSSTLCGPISPGATNHYG